MKIPGLPFHRSHSNDQPDRTSSDSLIPAQSGRRFPFCPQVELITVSSLVRPPINVWAKYANGTGSLKYTGRIFAGPLLSGFILETTVTGHFSAEEKALHVVAYVEMLTSDGVLIHKTDRATWRGTKDAILCLIRGESVAQCLYYLIGVPEFSVSDPRYAWLEQGEYLSHGTVLGDKLEVAHFRVLPPFTLADLKAWVDSSTNPS